MVSIFTQVIKSLLKTTLSQQIERSQLKDTHAVAPTVLSYITEPQQLIKPKRNIELSRSKQQIFNQLIGAIHTAVVEESQGDIAMAAFLRSCLDTSKSQTMQACDAHQQPLGTSEDVLDTLIIFVDKFYQASERLKLLDIPDEEGKFTQFTRVVVFYHAHRTMDTAHQSAYHRFVKNPSITTSNTFLQTLDQYVIKLFDFACENIAGQKASENFDEIKNKLGFFCLEHLELQYNLLLSQYQIASHLVPSYLAELLREAKVAILADTRIQESFSISSKFVPTLGFHGPSHASAQASMISPAHSKKDEDIDGRMTLTEV